MTNFPEEALSAEEVAALLFMREEEKLAHDVYMSMYDLYGTRIFSNISKSEQRHMDAVLCLLNKYGLDDPAMENGLGEFQNTDLKALYDGLIATGSLTLKDALMAGATIEDLDISDLATRLANVDNADIKAVFNELNKGSRNHLRAFNRNLVKMGVTYVPQYISQTEFDAIINASNETGGAICGMSLGNGPGNGSGNCNGNGPGNGTGVCPYGNNGGGGNGPGTGICPNGNTGGGGNGPGTGTCPNGNTGGGGNGPGTGTCPNGNTGGGGNGPGGGNGNGGGGNGPGGGNGNGGN